MEVFILTGGMSSRMGRPKSNLKLGGKTLVELIKKRLLEIDSGLVIKTVGSNEAMTADIEDVGRRGSSLNGIVSAMSHTDGRCALILSCDSPFIDGVLIKKLLNKNKQTHPYYTRPLPFPAVYEKKYLCIFLRALVRRDYRLMKTIDSLPFTCIKIKEESININNKRDYNRFRRLL